MIPPCFAGSAGTVAAWTAIAIPLTFAPSFAHPMGNSSINHYAGLEIRPDVIEIKYLLDFAEIPSARELESVDPDRDDRVTPEEREAYLREKTAEVIPKLRLEVNGRPLALRLDQRHVSFPAGEAGLSTVRIAWRLHANLTENSSDRNFLLWNDSNYERYAGWKEIRLLGTEGVGIGKTSLRRAPSSGELSDYPEGVFRPPNDTKAWCQFGPELEMTRTRAPTAPEPGPGPARAGRKGVRLLAIVVGTLTVAVTLGVLRFRRRRASTERGGRARENFF
jgi:hypothetical protein